MNIHTIFAAIATALAFLSILPYVRGIVHGTTQPAQATYLAKAALSFTLAISYLAVGAHAAAWIMLMYAGSAIAVVTLSARRGVGQWTPVDATVLAACGAGLLVWYTSGRPEIALSTTAAIKWAALLPTIAKLRVYPCSESLSSWYLAFVADVLNLFALPAITAAILLPALNEVLLSGVAILAISHSSASTRLL